MDNQPSIELLIKSRLIHSHYYYKEMDDGLQENRRIREKAIEEERKQKEKEKALDSSQNIKGSTSSIWIFFLSPENLESEEIKQITRIYTEGSENRTEFEPPICQYQSTVRLYLKNIPGVFKIVTDLKKASQALNYHIDKEIIEFYVLVQDEQEYEQAFGLQYEYCKITNIIDKLSIAVQRLQEQFDVQLIPKNLNGETAESHKYFEKFPSFMRLSGYDKYKAFYYRVSLYGAIKILDDQIKDRHQRFLRHCEKFMQKQEKQQFNKYRRVNPLIQSSKMYDVRAKIALKNYVENRFYFRILNSNLRLKKPIDQFNNCSFPIFETYHSIQYFHRKTLERDNVIGKRVNGKEQLYYRGVRLFRKDDFAYLKSVSLEGEDTGKTLYIEMFGFMSTSKSREKAIKFIEDDPERILIVVHVPEMKIPLELQDLNHGFVDLSEHNIYKEIDAKFHDEQEVLFNILNIYRVLGCQLQVIESNGQLIEFQLIHLEYGAIFKLLEKNPEDLTTSESDVLINYEYCTDLKNRIEDLGDVYEITNQFQASKNYYLKRVNSNREKYKNYFKLANAYHKNGEFKEAEKAIELSLNETKKAEQQIYKQVYLIHEKHSKICFDANDFVESRRQVEQSISELPKIQVIKKAQLIKKKGDILFLKGEIARAQQLYNESQKMMQNIEDEFQRQMSSLGWSQWKNKYCSCCLSQNEAEKNNITNMKAEIQKRKVLLKKQEKQISKVRQQINNALREVKQLVGDKSGYEKYVRKGIKLIAREREEKTDDPLEKVRCKMIQSQNSTLEQSEKSLKDALRIVQDLNPFTPLVAEIQVSLASKLKSSLDAKTIFVSNSSNQQENEQNAEMYEDEKNQQKYEQCEHLYNKAIKIFLLNNNNKNYSTEVVEARLELSDIHLKQSNFEKSEQNISAITKEEKSCKIATAKCHLIMSKILQSKGQIKQAFEKVEQSYNVYKQFCLKSEDPEYQEYFKSSDTYQDIVLHRCRLYLASKKHDQCLKDIENIGSSLNMKNNLTKNYLLLAQAYEIRGELEVKMGNIRSFDYYFEKAIDILKSSVGSDYYTGETYCNYAKNLTKVGETRKSAIMLREAYLILYHQFKHSSKVWPIYLCEGMKVMKIKPEKAIQYFQQCLSHASKALDKSHITLTKIRYLKYLASLEAKKNTFREQIIKEIEQADIESEEDNQRVSLKNWLKKHFQSQAV